MLGRDDGAVVMINKELEDMDSAVAHDDIVTAVACDETCTDRFASCSLDGECVLWRMKESSLQNVGQFRAHKGTVNDIAFNKNNSTFSTVGYDRSLRVWDSRSGFRGSAAIVTCCLNQIATACAWSPSEHIIFCGCEDGAICSVDTRKCDVVVSSSFRHDGRVTRVLFGEGAGGEMLSASADRLVVLVVT